MNGKNSLTAKVIVSFATAAILILVFVIFGCYRQGETDSTGTARHIRRAGLDRQRQRLRNIRRSGNE